MTKLQKEMVLGQLGGDLRVNPVAEALRSMDTASEFSLFSTVSGGNMSMLAVEEDATYFGDPWNDCESMPPMELSPRSDAADLDSGEEQTVFGTMQTCGIYETEVQQALHAVSRGRSAIQKDKKRFAAAKKSDRRGFKKKIKKDRFDKSKTADGKKGRRVGRQRFKLVD